MPSAVPFGAMLLLPLYFEIVRGRTPLDTGLLLAPRRLGAAAVIPLAGHFADKAGARRVVITGVLLALAGTATITPSMAAAFHGLAPAEMATAASAINVVQRVAGSIGSALLAVVLQAEMTARLPGFHGSIGQAAAAAAGSTGHVPAPSPLPSPPPRSSPRSCCPGALGSTRPRSWPPRGGRTWTRSLKSASRKGTITHD